MKTAKAMFESVMEKKNACEARRKARKRTLLKMAAPVALVLALVLGVGLTYGPAGGAGYKILLDVNPSIEIEVNGEDAITRVNGLNEDGEKIVGDKGLAGKEVADGVGELVSEMIEQGYISAEANSLLVTIEGAEKEKTEKVSAELTEKISSELTDKNVEGAIIMQELTDGEGLKETSETLGISPGKAQLIAQIVAQNSLHTYEELAAMTIHELNLLRVTYYVNLENGQTSGAPSTAGYIGSQKAAQIATEAARTAHKTVETELVCRAGVMLYCVEFEDAAYAYRYRVNAVTGAILTAEKSELGKNDFFQGDTPIATVGENAALAAALEHAGVDNAKLIRCKVKSDWVDGKVIYDLSFSDGRTSGKYVMDARTGQIIKYGTAQEPRDRSVKDTLIGEEKAKGIVLAKDGLVDGNVSKYEMQLQKDGDAYVYDMMFICNGVRYTARIAAADGAVLAYERIELKETGAPSAEQEKNPSAEENTTPIEPRT